MSPLLRVPAALAPPRRHAGTAVACCLLAAGTAAQGPHHEHGTARLDVAVQGPQLSVMLQVPLDSLLGFEHRPRTPAQQQAAQRALARLRDPAGWLRPDAGAACTLQSVTVHAPVLETAPGGTAPAGAGDAHGDLELAAEWRCLQPQQLAVLDVRLFDAFERIRRVQVQVAGPAGQHKRTLQRPAHTVRLK